MTKERLDKAKKLKLIITAGIGSDHTDLQAAMDKGITVAEVTFSNSYQSSVRLTRLGFPNRPQHDSRWQTEGRLPWGLRLRCGRTFRARNFVACMARSASSISFTCRV